jgi:hypothetical protein
MPSLTRVNSSGWTGSLLLWALFSLLLSAHSNGSLRPCLQTKPWHFNPQRYGTVIGSHLIGQ